MLKEKSTICKGVLVYFSTKKLKFSVTPAFAHFLYDSLLIEILVLFNEDAC